MEYNKILIACVDRDADIEIKTGIRGAIVGRENILNAALKLGLADPEESDANVLFYGVKLYDKLKKENKEVELAALSGDRDVGYTSDLKLSKQIDEVIALFSPDGVILVSDGAEDEHILPIFQSRAKIAGVERVVVKQSVVLESTYYVIMDFLEKVVNEPKLARVVFGVPALMLLTYMAFGANSWRIIAGIVGVFLFIKGFNLEAEAEKRVKSVVKALKKTMVTERASFFTYITGAIIFIIGIARGYQRVKIEEGLLYRGVPYFLSESIDLITISLVLVVMGATIDAVIENKKTRKYILLGIFILSLRFIINALSDFLLNAIGMQELIAWIVLGIVLPLLGFFILREPPR